MFETFDTVKDSRLRAYNRVRMFKNLLEDYGKDAARSYLEDIEPRDRASMLVVFNAIRTYGEDEVKRNIISSVEPEEAHIQDV